MPVVCPTCNADLDAGADLQPNALPDSQVQDAAPQSPYQRKAAGKGKATAGSSPDAAPTPGQAQAPQQLVQQQHQTRAGSRLHAAARAAVEAGALDAADAPYLDFNTSPSPSAAHMARATAMPEWQVSILSCGTVSDLWRLYSKRTRDEDLSFAEVRLCKLATHTCACEYGAWLRHGPSEQTMFDYRIHGICLLLPFCVCRSG